jgi:uncharacterized delta-60 repeat protein
MTYGGSPRIAKQSDGKTIIFHVNLTEYSGTNINGIARLNTDWTLDTTFNLGWSGFTKLLPWWWDVWSDIHVQPDNKIVLIGSFSDYNGQPSRGIIRLEPDGAIDTSFDVGLWFDGSYPNHSLIPLPNDEYFVLWFNATKYNTDFIPNFAKINTYGQLDTTFMNNYGGAGDQITAILPQSNGDYIFVYYTSLQVKKYSPIWVQDTSFNAWWAGFIGVQTPLILPSNGSAYSNPNVSDGEVLPDDSIIIVGAFSHYNGVPARGIVKMDKNGVIDTQFVTNIWAGLNGYTHRVKYDSFNDRVFVWGAFSQFNTIASSGFIALNQDGTHNTSFPTIWFNKRVDNFTILNKDTLYVQGEFNKFGTYNTLPGMAIFGPGCIPAPIPGACWTGHNATFTTSGVITGLCWSGTASAVSGSFAGPWEWTCAGQNGWADSPTCSATYAPPPPPPAPIISNCGPLPAYSIANTVTSITQSRNGSTRTPSTWRSYNLTPSTTECRYACEANYVWKVQWISTGLIDYHLFQELDEIKLFVILQYKVMAKSLLCENLRHMVGFHHLQSQESIPMEQLTLRLMYDYEIRDE